MYKWVDADGKVHYSDQAPPEGAKQQETVKVKTLHRPAAPAPQPDGKGAAPKAKTAADQDMDFRKRRLAAAEADAKRQQDADAAADKARRNASRPRAESPPCRTADGSPSTVPMASRFI